eukprot:TRINITY_DN12820_c0_g1_i7.p1 TRINITY_DN12820_c0_g1~~TRINITY_DN12820_c0_g1_i7.p1  ORF type:complete len:1379 (+),score=333.66 TRINITY_DN12820_c0_g1_i7:90-4226(+)
MRNAEAATGRQVDTVPDGSRRPSDSLNDEPRNAFFPLYSLRRVLRIAGQEECSGGAGEAGRSNDPLSGLRDCAPSPVNAEARASPLPTHGSPVSASPPASQVAAALLRPADLSVATGGLPAAGSGIASRASASRRPPTRDQPRRAGAARGGLRADGVQAASPRPAVSIDSVAVCRCAAYHIIAVACTNGAVVLRFSGDAAPLLGLADGQRRVTLTPAVHVITHFANPARAGHGPPFLAFSPDGRRLLAAQSTGGIWLVPCVRLLFPTSRREDTRSPLCPDEPHAVPRLGDYLKSTDPSLALSPAVSVPEGEEVTLVTELGRTRRSLRDGRGGQRAALGPLRSVGWWRTRKGLDRALVAADSGQLVIVCLHTRQQLRTVTLPGARPVKVQVVTAPGATWALVQHVDAAHRVMLEQAAGDPRGPWQETPPPAARRGSQQRPPQLTPPPQRAPPPPQQRRGSIPRGPPPSAGLPPPARRGNTRRSSSVPPQPQRGAQPQGRPRSTSSAAAHWDGASAASQGSRRSPRGGAGSWEAELVPHLSPSVSLASQVTAVEHSPGRHGVAVLTASRGTLELWDADPAGQRYPLYQFRLGFEPVRAHLTSSCIVCAHRPQTADTATLQRLSVVSRFAAERGAPGVLQALLLPGERVAGMAPGAAGRDGVEGVVVWTSSSVYELLPRDGATPEALFQAALLCGPRGPLSRETLAAGEGVATAFRLDVLHLFQAAADRCASYDPERAMQLYQQTANLPVIFARRLALPLPAAHIARFLQQSLRRLLREPARGKGGTVAEAGGLACLHVALALAGARHLRQLPAATPDPAPRPPRPGGGAHAALSPLLLSRLRGSGASAEPAPEASHSSQSVRTSSAAARTGARSGIDAVAPAREHPVASPGSSSRSVPRRVPGQLSVSHQLLSAHNATGRHADGSRQGGGLGGISAQATAASGDAEESRARTAHGAACDESAHLGDSHAACDASDRPYASPESDGQACLSGQLAGAGTCLATALAAEGPGAPTARLLAAASGAGLADEALAASGQCPSLSPEEVVQLTAHGLTCSSAAAAAALAEHHPAALCAAAGGGVLAGLPDGVRVLALSRALAAPGEQAQGLQAGALRLLREAVLGCCDVQLLRRAAAVLAAGADGGAPAALHPLIPQEEWTEALVLALCRIAELAAAPRSEGLPLLRVQGEEGGEDGAPPRRGSGGTAEAEAADAAAVGALGRCWPHWRAEVVAADAGTHGRLAVGATAATPTQRLGCALRSFTPRSATASPRRARRRWSSRCGGWRRAAPRPAPLRCPLRLPPGQQGTRRRCCGWRSAGGRRWDCLELLWSAPSAGVCGLWPRTFPSCCRTPWPHRRCLHGSRPRRRRQQKPPSPDGPRALPAL